MSLMMRTLQNILGVQQYNLNSWNYAARLLPVTNTNVYTEIVALLKID